MAEAIDGFFSCFKEMLNTLSHGWLEDVSAVLTRISRAHMSDHRYINDLAKGTDRIRLVDDFRVVLHVFHYTTSDHDNIFRRCREFLDC